MRFQFLFWVLIFLSIRVEGQRLVLDGQEVFINGINLPWRHYGQDFGRAKDGKYYYSRSYYENVFKSLKEKGVNTIRTWLHCSGRHSPVFGQDQMTRGLPPGFIDDFIDFLDLAGDYELLIIPVLWSFEMVDEGKSRLITDYMTTRSYIDNALIPLVSQTKDHCHILAWEIINEPEWAMDIPFAGTMENTVKSGDMQRFVGLCAEAIHQHSGHMVTVGSAGLRFLTNQYIYAFNYWHDTELSKESLSCSAAFLDFYSVHYYKKAFENLSPHKQSWSSLHLGKPVLVSEFGQDKPTLDFMEKVFSNGYAGILPWSFTAGDGVGRWSDYQDHLARMAEKHRDFMPEFPLCIWENAPVIFQSCLIYPNPAKDYFKIDNHTGSLIPVRVNMINFLGQAILHLKKEVQSSWEIDIRGISQGVYIVQIFSLDQNQQERLMSTQRIIITN